jgi:glycosyltransferase involved in cell wall biosynthesis
MKILYDDSLGRNPAGTGTFSRSLLAALRRTDGVEVVVSRMDSSSLASIDVQGKHALGRLRSAMRHLQYFGWQLPARARQAGCDMIFSPSGLGPLRGRIPSVITVHDLTLLRYPSTVHWLSRAYLDAMLRIQLRRAAAVCTVSHAVAAELQARFPALPTGRLHVVPDAPDPELLSASPVPVDGVDRPFFLMVGTIEPRKNHVTVINAFGRYLHQYPDAAERLVLAGSPGWLYGPVFDAVRHLGLESRVLRVGHIDAGRLQWLYRGARALLFASVYEGFGIPVVEAFALDCPVIASNIPAVLEVAGEGTATLIDPLDVPAWAAALAAAATTPPNDAMRAAARTRARAFTWEGSAAALRDALAAVRPAPRRPGWARV